MPTLSDSILRHLTMPEFEVEYTDTFGGEANYCWCNRETITIPENATDRTIAILAKRAMGLNGARGRSSWLGDMYKFRPYGSATVLFARPIY
jgi:hypothetical protein